MASYESDGGAGRKFRRRPFRKAPATPYDRPPAAVRRGNPNPNGWISKIVEPATRLIARGASKFFGSVFQKRLTGPQPQPPHFPPPPAESLRHEQTAPEAACDVGSIVKPSEKATKQDDVDLEGNAFNLNHTDGCQQEKLNGIGGFVELEQLRQQKTFTREEFDRMTDLPRSRTVEPSTSKQPVDSENKEEATFTRKAQGKTPLVIEASTSLSLFSSKKPEKVIICDEEENMKSLTLYPNTKDSAVDLRISTKKAVDVAKTYMGLSSRSSEVSPPPFSFRKQMLQDDTTETHLKKQSQALLASGPVHFPRISNQSEIGYMTPRPRGRSAVYKMSRSPYFNVHRAQQIRDGRAVRSGLASSSRLSPLAPSTMLSSGKKVLKRGSAALDNDVGSFDYVRRIRQKPELMSTSEEHFSPRICLPLTSSCDQDYYVKYKLTAQNTSACVTPVPPQSTEMARKIFLELDKIESSPKEKSSGKKGIDNVDTGSPLPSFRSTISPKQGKIKVNDELEDGVTVAKATHDCTASPVSSMMDSSTVPVREKQPSPQTTIPEKKSPSWGSSFNVDSASRQSTSGNEKVLGFSEACFPNSMSTVKFDVKASDKTASPKQVIQSPTTAFGSQPSPTLPTSPLADCPASKNEISVPVPTSGSDSLQSGASAPPAAGRTETLGVDKRVKAQSDGELHKSLGNGNSSCLSTSVSSFLFTSRASNGQNHENGSPASTAVNLSSIGNLSNFSSQPASAQPAVTSTTPFQFGSESSDTLIGAANASSSSTTSSALSSPIKGIIGFSASAESNSSSPSSIPGLKFSSSASSATSLFANTATASSKALGLTAGFSSVAATAIYSSAATASSSLFNSNSPPSTSFISPSASVSSPILPSTGFSFGAAPSSVKTVDASARPVFSFSSVVTTTSTDSSAPLRPIQKQGAGFGSSSPGSERMNVEDAMADDSIQASTPSAPTCGQPATTFSTRAFQFGAPVGSSMPSAPSSGQPASTYSTPAFQSGTPASVPAFGQPASTASTQAFQVGAPAGISTPSAPSSGQPASTFSTPAFQFGASPGSSTPSTPAPGQQVNMFSTPAFQFGAPAGSLTPPAPAFGQPVSTFSTPTFQFGTSAGTSTPLAPSFGQPANTLPAPSLQFGAPAGLSVFQAGSNQNSAALQNPFQSPGSLEFNAGGGGGGFSLGSGAGDKSGRRIVRVKRDKHRKK